MTSKPRSSADRVDLILDPSTIPESAKRGLDTVIEIVHAALRDLSNGQMHKVKLRSLMALLYLSYGMKAGMDHLGAFLTHKLRRQQDQAQAAREGDLDGAD